MNIAIELLRAPHVGVRDLKQNLSKFLKVNKLLVITERGKPIDVILPYLDILNLVDIIDEVTDAETLATVIEGKKSIKMQTKGIPVSNLFKAIRRNRK